MISKIKLIAFATYLSLLIVFVACNNSDEVIPDVPPTELPSDTTKLFIEKSNLKSDTTILYSNGGPSVKLFDDDFDDLNLSNYHEVYVHQVQSYNSAIILELGKYLTFERAIEENAKSIEMLHRVAQYFRNRNKTVFIVGHSFGAVLIPQLIATKDNLAAKYLIMAGRLDFPDIVWQGFRDRQYYFFEQGIIPFHISHDTEFFTEMNDTETEELYASIRLIAAFGMNRYTKLLENKNLSHVIYAYGEADEEVGRLTKEEVDFLNSRKAKVYTIKNGDHNSMFIDPHRKNLVNMLFQ